MAAEPDPYRTLELASGASMAEVKRAYRRLAKVHHPDAAGERSLPRFLAIQAAYEQLIVGAGATTGRRRASSTPQRPSQADSDRSDATHRAYGGRPRSAPSGGSGEPTDRSSASSGPTGGSARTGRRRSEPRSRPRGTPAGGSHDPAPGDPASGATDGPPNKATLGSTSYDGADATPFEPDWGGASWYGTTSGTYWTLNPKEYADPRKHGPEYQARARRATRPAGFATTDAAAAVDGAPGGTAPAAGPAPASDPTPAGPTHTTSSWWDSTTGPTGPTGSAPRDPASDAGTPAGPGPQPRAPRAAAPAATAVPHPLPDLERAAADLGHALTDEMASGPRGRVVRAIVGWLPIAFGVGWLVGELTGCGRFAATCDGMTDPFVLLVQAGVLAMLLLVPVVASVAATASIALLVAALGAAIILSASGGAAGGPARESALGAILVVGWLAGVVVALVRRARAPSPPTRPVS